LVDIDFPSTPRRNTGEEVQFHSLTSAVHGNKWSRSHPERFTPTNKPTEYEAGWAGLRPSPNDVKKKKNPPFFGCKKAGPL